MFTRPSRASADTPEVKTAEKKIGAVLADLETQTGGEVQDLDLQDVVDTDDAGHPVIQKEVDVQLHQRPRRAWSR